MGSPNFTKAEVDHGSAAPEVGLFDSPENAVDPKTLAPPSSPDGRHDVDGLPETAPLLQLAEQEASTSGFYTSRSVGDEGEDGLIRPTLDTGTFDKREEAAAGDRGDGGGAQRQ